MPGLGPITDTHEGDEGRRARSGGIGNAGRCPRGGREDAREGRFLDQTPQAVEDVRRAGHRLEVVFLESADETLLRRFSETRRRHPLSPESTVAEGIALERKLLSALRGIADLVIDTTRMNVHELRDVISARFGAAGDADVLNVTLVSFGYRNGIPSNSDLVLDLRFLPNPYFVEGLKAYPGTDPRVAEWVLARPQTQEFVANQDNRFAVGLITADRKLVQDANVHMRFFTLAGDGSTGVAPTVSDWLPGGAPPQRRAGRGAVEAPHRAAPRAGEGHPPRRGQGVARRGDTIAWCPLHCRVSSSSGRLPSG